MLLRICFDNDVRDMCIDASRCRIRDENKRTNESTKKNFVEQGMNTILYILPCSL